MNSREAAALDNYIAGGHYSEARVIAHCANGHRWPAKEWTEYGASGIDPDECPECHGEAEEETEPDYGD